MKIDNQNVREWFQLLNGKELLATLLTGGSRSVKSVYSSLSRTHPEMTEDDIRKVFDWWTTRGYARRVDSNGTYESTPRLRVAVEGLGINRDGYYYLEREIDRSRR